MKFHPLFTMNCDLNDPEQAAIAETDIGFMHVYRIEFGREKIIGGQFTAEQLPNFDAFKAMFGGGDYCVKGRPPNNQGFCRTVHLTVEGPPKPDPFMAAQSAAGAMPAAPAVAGFTAEQLMALRAALGVSQPQPLPPPQAGGIDSNVLIALINGQQAAADRSLQMIMAQGQQQMTALVEFGKILMAGRGGPSDAQPPTSPLHTLETALQVIEKLKPQAADKPFTLETVAQIVSDLLETFKTGKDALKVLEDAAAEVPATPIASVGGVAHTEAAA